MPAPLVYVFSSLTFPPREGQHLNSALLLRAMRAAGHPVSVLTWVRDAADFDGAALAQWAGGLTLVHAQPTRLNYPLRLLVNLLPGAPAGTLWHALQAALKRQPAAIVQLEGIGLLPWVRQLGAYPLVVSTTDAWSLRQRRLAVASGSQFRSTVLSAYAAVSAWAEKRWMPLAGAVHVVSPEDAAYLRHLVPGAHVHDIPVALAEVPSPSQGATAPPVLVVWGDIGVPHLLAGVRWLLAEVMPRVRATTVPQLLVLGRRAPPESLQALAPQARFLIWVDDVDGLLRQARAVVLPDAQGTGLKNRAVQAMACAVPVVGTPAALEGFPVTDGLEAYVRGDAAAFADALSELLDDPGRAAAMGQVGRQFVLARYTVQAMSAAWSTLYSRLAPTAARDVTP